MTPAAARSRPGETARPSSTQPSGGSSATATPPPPSPPSRPTPACRTTPSTSRSAASQVSSAPYAPAPSKAADPCPPNSDQTNSRPNNADPRQIIDGWGTLTAEVAPLVAPILLLIRDAATTDPVVRDLLEELDADRLRRMTDNARRLHDAGHLRPGVTLDHAADVLWTYSAPELYELLVLRRGWSLPQFSDFIAQAMIEALL